MESGQRLEDGGRALDQQSRCKEIELEENVAYGTK